MITLVILASGIILVFEAPVRKEMIQKDLLLSKGSFTCPYIIEEGSFHLMIYFVVVTVATVGFGDVVPYSTEGRICIIILIMLVLVLIPKQTNELIRLMGFFIYSGMQSIYARSVYKSNADVPHIIICGQVNVSALKNFCKELFHPDHGSMIDKNAIILQQNIPSAEMEIFLHNPQFEMFLFYLQGNPLNERDLNRIASSKAKACIILTNKSVTDSHSADHKNILIGLSVKKYVYNQTGFNIPLCMQLIKPESKTHYYSSLHVKSNDQLIIVEEFKMNLLAKSCFCPGIISMISNLITSAGDQDTSDFDEEWQKEYALGMGHEIYRTDLSFKFQGKSFSEVATIIYNEFQGILFGIELEVGGQTIIRLNPGPYIIPETVENKVRGYIICEDKKVADQVATYEMNPLEISNYQNSKEQTSQKQIKYRLNDKEYDHLLDEEEEDKTNIHKIEEEELMESDYILLMEPTSLLTASPISLKDSNEVTNHIIVCGIHPSIYYFLLPLRAKYLKELQYVVILAQEKPSEIWEYINRFPKVLYIRGSPLNEEDLIRANINFADKAVILGQENEKIVQGTENFDEMLDTQSIFIFKAIKKINPNLQVMVELVYSSNIDFFLETDMNKKSYTTQYDLVFHLIKTPLFAAGEVYISSMIDTLTCQSYFNPHIVTILQQILTGGKQSSPVIRAICEHADLRQSNLWQIPVPEDYINKTFGELFNYLSSERNLIPLGLYRLPGAIDNSSAFCFTNPGENIKLTHRDKVFVLAYYMPNDLLNGILDAENQEEDKGVSLYEEKETTVRLNANSERASLFTKKQSQQDNFQSNRFTIANLELDNINSSLFLEIRLCHIYGDGTTD